MHGLAPKSSIPTLNFFGLLIRYSQYLNFMFPFGYWMWKEIAKKIFDQKNYHGNVKLWKASAPWHTTSDSAKYNGAKAFLRWH